MFARLERIEEVCFLANQYICSFSLCVFCLSHQLNICLLCEKLRHKSKGFLQNSFQCLQDWKELMKYVFLLISTFVRFHYVYSFFSHQLNICLLCEKLRHKSKGFLQNSFQYLQDWKELYSFAVKTLTYGNRKTSTY